VKNGDFYDFADNNRRAFALLSIANGVVYEIPSFEKRDGRTQVRSGNPNLLPIQFSSNDLDPPAIFLVTRNASLGQEVVVEEHSFAPMIRLKYKNSLLGDVAITAAFTPPMTKASSGFHLWQARNEIVIGDVKVKWHQVQELSIYWQSANGEFLVSPWSAQPAPNDIVNLSLRMVRVGEPHTQVVLSSNTDKKTALRFQEADGTSVVVSKTLNLSQDGKYLKAIASEVYKAAFDTAIQNAPKIVQLVTLLPTGEMIAASKEFSLNQLLHRQS
jgi:hypothetical protein